MCRPNKKYIFLKIILPFQPQSCVQLLQSEGLSALKRALVTPGWLTLTSSSDASFLRQHFDWHFHEVPVH